LRAPARRIALVANIGEEGEGNLNGMCYLCWQSPLAATLRSFMVSDGPGTDSITAHGIAEGASGWHGESAPRAKVSPAAPARGAKPDTFHGGRAPEIGIEGTVPLLRRGGGARYT
jgi:hypothetical protein